MKRMNWPQYLAGPQHMMVMQKNHHDLDKGEDGWAGRNSKEPPDIEHEVQAMNLLPQALDFQGILFGHPSRLIDGKKKSGMIHLQKEYRLISDSDNAHVL